MTAAAQLQVRARAQGDCRPRGASPRTQHPRPAAGASPRAPRQRHRPRRCKRARRSPRAPPRARIARARRRRARRARRRRRRAARRAVRAFVRWLECSAPLGSGPRVRGAFVEFGGTYGDFEVFDGGGLGDGEPPPDAFGFDVAQTPGLTAAGGFGGGFVFCVCVF